MDLIALRRYNFIFSLLFTPSFIYHLIIMYLIYCFYLFPFLSHLVSNSSHGSTSNAFIFSLINNEGLAPFKSMVKNPSYAIYRHSSYGPIFGNGNDIYISNNANSNTNSFTNFGSYYSVPSGVQDRRTILAGTYMFTPDEVEVFYLS